MEHIAQEAHAATLARCHVALHSVPGAVSDLRAANGNVPSSNGNDLIIDATLPSVKHNGTRKR